MLSKNMKQILLSLSLMLVALGAANAQLITYPAAAKDNFFFIGGYSYTHQFGSSGVAQPKPLVVTGPSPQNSFTFSATVAGGGRIYTVSQSAISTDTASRVITLTFTSNNIRKFGAEVYVSRSDGSPIAGTMLVQATTNFGHTAMLNSDLNNRFVGFRVSDDNEYITSIVLTPPPSPPPASGLERPYAAIRNIIMGDDKPQNCAISLYAASDNYVEIPSTVGNFDSYDDFTVSAWVKPASIQPYFYNVDNYILEKWTQNQTSFPFVIRYLNQTSGALQGKILAARFDGDNNPTIVSAATVNDNKWHHIAFVKNGLDLKLYIDGLVSGTTTDNTGINSTTNTSPLFIGARGDAINRFKGAVDDVRIRSVALTQAQIQQDMNCEITSTANLVAAYDFNNGSPDENNVLVPKVYDFMGINHGVLKGGAPGFLKSRQVRYVKSDATGTNDGSSWVNAYTNLQSALVVDTNAICNETMEVWVAKGTYKPHTSNREASFRIPRGFQVYGGFAGTEGSAFKRIPSLIFSTNKTILSGDLLGNDTPNFGNRAENSKTVINFSNTGISTLLDGFEVTGGNTDNQGGGVSNFSANSQITNCRIVDNQANEGGGIAYSNSGGILKNCIISGNMANQGGGIGEFVSSDTSTVTMTNCIISGNKATVSGGGSFVKAQNSSSVGNLTITNCTFAANTPQAMANQTLSGAAINSTLTNVIVYGNESGISNEGSTITNTITYSLVQGVTSGTGNLDASLINPNFFVLPLASSAPTTAGDFHLKFCSKLINAGINLDFLLLDLDRKSRPAEGMTDMGVYEYYGDTPSGVINSIVTGTITASTYVVTGLQTITATAKVIPPAGSVLFKAPNSIILQPGFEARGLSQSFKAKIEGCVD